MAVCVTVAAGFIPLVAAAPAQASPASCESYLRSTGRYVIGPQIKAGCSYSRFGSHVICQAKLVGIGVRPTDATAACLP
ncbi:hypothetical protein BKD26_01745 [Streptomyces sp. CB03238]|nr:hypothetical protein BKD26_01745 [Streptomyces sp. CB03238]